MPTTPPEPLLWTINQAAARLNTSRTRLYAMLASGELRSVTLGARQRIADDELRRFIAALPSVSASGGPDQ